MSNNNPFDRGYDRDAFCNGLNYDQQLQEGLENDLIDLKPNPYRTFGVEEGFRHGWCGAETGENPCEM